MKMKNRQLPEKFAHQLVSYPETGMGYQIATITLTDGRKFERVCIIEGYLASIYGNHDIPFDASEVESILITHDKGLK